MAAQTLLGASETAILLGADEGHDRLSSALDSSIRAGDRLADGGGALHVSRDRRDARCLVRLAHYSKGSDESVAMMIAALGGAERVHQDCVAVFVGVPAGDRQRGERQLVLWREQVGAGLPIWRYREQLGQFASASATATALAALLVGGGVVPGLVAGGMDRSLAQGQSILVLGTGSCLTAMEVRKP